jgi:hypothetical protein
MNRLVSLCALAIATSACGGGTDAPAPGLGYTDPPAGGALRLVKNPKATPKAMMLDLVVGDAALTGFSTGFDLPLDTTKVTLGLFTPGTVLSPGTAPVAAAATMPSQGALAGTLVIGLTQKASGTGAIATDTALPPKTVLFTVELDAVQPFAAGVVFDGTAAGFALPSGGLRNKAGMTVVDASAVKIGKLEVHP